MAATPLLNENRELHPWPIGRQARPAAREADLDRQRWVVERGFAHVHNLRRLRTREERYPEIHTALLVLAREPAGAEYFIVLATTTTTREMRSDHPRCRPGE